VLKTSGLVLLALAAVVLARGQESQPKVRINYLNVCAPSEAEEKEIASALGRIPSKAAFSQDFEVARGRSSAADLQIEGAGEAGPSYWVRIRREFRPESPITNVQYSFSLDEKSATETMVFRTRESKDVLQIAIQDTVNVSGGPASVLATDTPPTRVKIERFGKSGLALARCTGADQGRYEPLFRSAAQIMSAYRNFLAVRRTVPADLARLTSSKTPVGKKK
jgi:hypothetical protein